MKIKDISKQKGFTLLELLLYVSGLLILGTIIVTLIVQFYSLYREIVAAPRADRTALLVVDRITKEIRSADHINMSESQFNTENGVLDISTNENSTTVERKFFIQNGVVKYQEGNEDIQELSSDDFFVSNFNFYYVPTPVSQAVRFSLELQYQAQNATQTKSYTGFAILRESYE